MTKMDPMTTKPVEEFAQTIQSVCGAFNVEPQAPHCHITGHVSVHRKAGFDIACVTQNARYIERRREDIKRDPGDHFFLIVQESGSCRMGQRQFVDMQPGDMMIVDSALPSKFEYNGHMSRQVSLHLPREEQVQRFGKRIQGDLHIPRAEALGQAMRSILASLRCEGTNHHEPVTEAFYSVLGAYLFNRALGQAADPDPTRVLLKRADEVIAQHYRDPMFGPTDVADKLNVSLRHLQRAFKRDDSTVHARLQHLRLHAARRRIESATNAQGKTVAQIAFACGFSDLSTFYRQYKTQYDTSPGSDLKARLTLQ